MIVDGLMFAWMSVLTVFALCLLISIAKEEWNDRRYFYFAIDVFMILSGFILLVTFVLSALQIFGIL